MKVYFTASTTHDGEYRAQYQRIISIIKKYKHSLTSGEQIAETILMRKDRNLTARKIFQRERTGIDSADCVVSEVSKPSSGMGGEIVYALTRHKPVLALFYKDSENKISPMIAGNPSEHLYLEHYEDDNLEILLKNFFAQVARQNNRKGKLIVIDGGDGSGKATQSELLIGYLKGHGAKVKYMDFPRYYTSFHGRMVGRFLSGEFGKLDDISPYLSSLAYALDRASAKEEMDTWLAHGGTIVSNRYATSSMAHQAARFPDNKRKEFVEWIDELEYKVHKIPREDVVVYLYVPWKAGLELTQKKGERGYIGRGMDLAEKDIRHRMEAEKMYLFLAKTRGNWILINCVKGKSILSKETIHALVLRQLQKRKLIP